MNQSIYRILGFLWATLIAASAFADVPGTLPVQGYLTDEEDAPIDGVEQVTFTIYDAAEAGTSLWTEQVSLDIDQGAFVAYLGADSPIDSSIFTGEGPRYLGVAIGSDDELSPRFELGTVPYAHVAEFANVADSLQGLTPDDFVETTDFSWTGLQDIPAALVEIAELSCGQGETALFNGASWICAPGPFDTLGELNCSIGETAAWDGSDWTCATVGSDTLDALNCVSGEVALWNGTQWVCSPTSADTLDLLTCTAGQVAKWNGTDWACANDVDTDTTLSEAEVDAFVADNGYLTDGSTLLWSNLSGIPTDLADGDDNTLGELTCTADQVAKWNGTSWICADDVNTQLTEAEVDAFVADNGYLESTSNVSWGQLTSVPPGLDNGDDDTLNALPCSAGQVAKWDGLDWVCADDMDTDTNTDTLAALSCASGELAKWNGTGWECASDVDTDTLGALACASGELAKWNGTGWECAADVDTDTDTLASLGCADGDRVRYSASTGWECETPDVASTFECVPTNTLYFASAPIIVCSTNITTTTSSIVTASLSGFALTNLSSSDYCVIEILFPGELQYDLTYSVLDGIYGVYLQGSGFSNASFTRHQVLAPGTHEIRYGISGSSCRLNGSKLEGTIIPIQ